ncbi:hypothetical protein VULLAG_LOCUS15906 [Vulpes lagopus]
MALAKRTNQGNLDPMPAIADDCSTGPLLLEIVLTCGFILNNGLVFSLCLSGKPQAQVRQPPEMSPGHSKPREADSTFQEQRGMPSFTNKYHIPLCSVLKKRFPELL